MNKLRLIGLAVAGISITPALAAASPWDGWYLGGTLGGAMQQGCNTLTPQGQWVDPLFVDDFNFFGPYGTGCGANATGVMGGITAGANMQSGNMVFGVETDLSAISGTSTRNASGVFASGPPSTITETTSIPWLATIRPRLGALLSERTLLYITGGLAIGQVNGTTHVHYSDSGDPSLTRANSDGSYSAIVPGWTIGAGMEVALGNRWTLKGEYLYTDLGSMNYNTFYPTVVTPPEVYFHDWFTENIAAKTHVSVIRVGLNYHFDDMPGDMSGGADLPTPEAVPMIDGIQNWRGMYAGATIGGAFGQSTATNVDIGSGSILAPGDTFTASTSGVVGGVEAGYNWQAGRMVAGIEADVGYVGFSGSGASSLDPTGETVVTATGGPAATIRGRVGFTAGRALLYATGGVMFANLHATVKDPILSTGSPNVFFMSETGTQTGFVVGGGGEYALNGGWSVKAEYQYFDLGTTRVSGPSLAVTVPQDEFAYDIHNRGSIIRVGLNKKF